MDGPLTPGGGVCRTRTAAPGEARRIHPRLLACSTTAGDQAVTAGRTAAGAVIIYNVVSSIQPTA